MAREDLAASYALHRPRSRRSSTRRRTPWRCRSAFKKSYEAFMDAEFWRMDLPSGLAGTPAPRALWWSLAEMVLGSNAPIWMYASGPSFATTLYREGTEEQKRWAKLFAEKRWGSTMVLTEPDAGSDVGAGRTQRDPAAGRFLAHRGRQAVHHERRARPVRQHHPLRAGAASCRRRRRRQHGYAGRQRPGTKGLSLFVVPKFHFDAETGELGERNGVFARTSSTRWASRRRPPAR